MSRKSQILGLSLVGICGFAVSSASAQLLPGNIWPNSDLETPASGPDIGGSTAPRPAGWNLGGNDYGTTGTPVVDIYDSTPPVTSTSPPSGAALSGTHTLMLNDSSGSAYGEWFSDLEPVPAGSESTPTSAGTPFLLRFNIEYQGLTQDPSDRSPEDFRVSVVWGTPAGGPYGSFGGPDYNISIPSPDQDTWLQVTETLIAPIDPSNPLDPVTSMSVHLASGGGSGAEGQIWLDDVSVAAVPEPASLIGMTSGALLLLSRRRRKA
ncbi:MAG TPA: PEP-CTERM sorting domain-containing protein [Tepidisphaeraceae bacterium]